VKIMPVYSKLSPDSQKEVTKGIKDHLRNQGVQLTGPADLEAGFKAGFLAQGMSDAEATRKARIAAEGR
jgi:predicted small metal-binding protein